MYPPIFTTVATDTVVQASFGVSPVRVYPFGEAPAKVTKPYAVWQVVTGFPENCLGGVPDMDSFLVQLDIYADTGSEARVGAEALRDAIEPAAHVVAWRGEGRDPDTNNYRYSFDSNWWVSRAAVPEIVTIDNLAFEGDFAGNIIALEGDFAGDVLILEGV